jgi:hypothetical protein
MQPFPRDFWNLANAAKWPQLEARAALRDRIWRHIDPFVDFYVSSVYVFYNRPDSVYYISANIEETFRRTRKYGTKPVYAYVWLRYHPAGSKSSDELAPFLTQAIGLVPYFSGARGVVLWGWEPGRKGQYYSSLPRFMDSVGHISDLSTELARGTLSFDPHARELWRDKRPLIRAMTVGPDKCIFLATNPWQSDLATSVATVPCGERRFQISIRGRDSYLYRSLGQTIVPITPSGK